MKLDINLLKKINKKVNKWSSIAYWALSSILCYKTYRYISDYINSYNWEIVSHNFQSIFYSIRELLDSFDGWVVFWILVSIVTVSCLICSYLQKKITQQGGSLLDQDEC